MARNTMLATTQTSTSEIPTRLTSQAMRSPCAVRRARRGVVDAPFRKIAPHLIRRTVRRRTITACAGRYYLQHLPRCQPSPAVIEQRGADEAPLAARLAAGQTPRRRAQPRTVQLY